MFTFHIADMTCGHCAAAITRAVKALDADARVEVSLGQHRVTVHSERAGREAVEAAIRGEGYTPVAGD